MNGSGTEVMNDTTEAVSGAASSATDAVTTTTGNAVNAASGAMTSATDAASGAMTNATDAAGNAVSGAMTEIKDAASLTTDAAGNLVDKAGNVVRKAGTFTKDASGKIVDKAQEMASDMSNLKAFSMDDAGNLVDGSGKVVYKKGDFTEKDGVYYDKDGNKIGRFLKKVGAAIAGAANKTADAFKNTFGGMFKKEKGTSHTLQAMTWKDNSHKLAGYSQEEIKGLVAALKANPNAKIEVQATSAEGGKKLSKMRAQVVRDIMVSLGGLPDSQISAKGMGEGSDKIEIVVK